MTAAEKNPPCIIMYTLLFYVSLVGEGINTQIVAADRLRSVRVQCPSNTRSTTSCITTRYRPLTLQHTPDARHRLLRLPTWRTCITAVNARRNHGDGGSRTMASLWPPQRLSLLSFTLVLWLLLPVANHGVHAAPDITMSIHGAGWPSAPIVGGGTVGSGSGIGTADDHGQHSFTINQVRIAN